MDDLNLRKDLNQLINYEYKSIDISKIDDKVARGNELSNCKISGQYHIIQKKLSNF